MQLYHVQVITATNQYKEIAVMASHYSWAVEWVKNNSTAKEIVGCYLVEHLKQITLKKRLKHLEKIKLG